MSELEELPSWAGRSNDGQASDAEAVETTQVLSSPPEPPQQDGGRGRWRIPLLILFGVFALVGVGALGYFLADSGSSDTEATADNGEDDLTEETTATSAETEEQSDAATGTDGEQTEAGGEDEAEADAEEAEEQTATTVDEDSETVTVDVGEDGTEEDGAADGGDADAPEASDSDREAVFRGGKVYLTGSVPSEEIGQLIEERAAAVVGPDNVVNEYTIDPTVTIEPGDSAPLYVEDVVLFEFNSIAIAPAFLPILDLGTLLLRQNPQASVTVVTRTDAIGSEEVNLDVSTKRAQAVINYWLGKGVNPDQINADPRGEEGASEDDDEQTASLNRRAEFIITGLLD